MSWQHYCLIIAVMGTGYFTVTASAECAASPPCVCIGPSVYCNSLKLNKIPAFHKTDELYDIIELASNNITRLEAAAFSNLSTTDDPFLSLDNNPISYVDDMAFAGLENTSIGLFLRNTQLLVLPKALNTLNIISLYITGMQALDPSVMVPMGFSLKSLHIDMKGIREWPDEMKYLTNLNDLEISRIPGLPEHAFDGFRELLELQIDNLTLSHSPVAICDLNHLYELTLRYAHIPIRDFIPACQRPMVTVNTVHFVDSGLVYLSDVFTTFPRVAVLSIQSANITYIDDNTIPDQNELTDLLLSRNMLTSLPYALRKLKTLQTLSFDNNEITSVEARDFYNMPNLRSLDLHGNPLHNVSEFAFINCTSLSILNLRFTQLVTVPRAILHLPSIETVHLEGTKIECNCDLHWLSGWTRLDNVHIYGNCYQSTESISDFVRAKLRFCPTSPIG